MYKEKILDMVEFGVDDFIAAKTLRFEDGLRPILLFQGDQWEVNTSLSKVRNLLLDYVTTGILEQVSIPLLTRVIVFSALDEKTIKCSQYEVNRISEALAYTNELEPTPVGPHFTLSLRRANWADDDIWKQATKKRKPQSQIDKKKRNITTNVLGEERG